MKLTKRLTQQLTRIGLAAVLLFTLNLQLSTAHAQGTAFTYQGLLDSGGTPVNGASDLTFTLYNAATLGATVGTSNVFNDLPVSNGLFTVTLDFGAGAFNGAARWLEIAARPGASTGAYTNLAPRQPVTPTPYAMFAGGASAAGVSGTLPASALSGVNGGGLIGLNATNLAGTVADARLSTNVALRAGGNSFSGNQTILGGIRLDGANVAFSQSSSGKFEIDAPGIFGGRMTVLTNGNVGIGTTTPNAPLQVVTASSFPNPGISLTGSGADLMLSLHNFSASGHYWNLLSSGTGSGVPGALRFYDATSGGDRMVITPDGNVGIGTVSPGAKLEVNGGIAVAAGANIASYGRLHIQSQAGEPLYLNPFTGAGDVIIGGGGANPNLVLTGGEVYCVAVNLTSDRNAKEDFKPVSPRDVLAKVAALPITEWQYKTAGDARHIGPMAQDFHAAFGTGRDDKHIASVDADGVALAAIQGLNEKLDEKAAEVESLKQSVAELKEMVKQLTQPVGR